MMQDQKLEEQHKEIEEVVAAPDFQQRIRDIYGPDATAVWIPYVADHVQRVVGQVRVLEAGGVIDCFHTPTDFLDYAALCRSITERNKARIDQEQAS